MGLLNPTNIPYTDETDQVKFKLIWQLTVIGCFVLSLLTFIFFFDSSDAKYTYLIGLCIAAGGLTYLQITKKYFALYIIYATAGTIILQIDSNITIDTPHLSNFFWVLLVTIMTVFGCNLRIASFFLIVNLLGIIIYSQLSLNRHYKAMNGISNVNGLAVALELVAIISIISYIVFLFVKTRRTAELKLIEANKALAAQNKEILKRDLEKTVLVKEIHHRVKNNLQIIISLLRLQMTEIKSSEAKNHFSEAINRVMVMSSIHQKLYQENNLTDFNLKDYIEELAYELRTFFIEDDAIIISVKTNYQNIDLKTVVPVGLLLNELLSNSFKYAFKSATQGRIDIILAGNKDHFTLSYSDNGKWLKKENDDNGFGLELIEILTEQLNGGKTIEINEKGTFYTFKLQSLNDNP
jgi:two-component sensor histidine kinase